MKGTGTHPTRGVTGSVRRFEQENALHRDTRSSPAVFPISKSGKLVSPLTGPTLGGLEEEIKLLTMQLAFEVIGIYPPASESPAQIALQKTAKCDLRANELYASNKARKTREFINTVDIGLQLGGIGGNLRCVSTYNSQDGLSDTGRG